jgi:aminoglycoside phosphotransferase (APT) family kinase protein
VNEAVRRVDWRFVLGRPRLGPVQVIEPVDAELAEAVRLVATGDGPGGLVLRGGDPEALRAAAALVPPGGWVWAEVPGRGHLGPWLAGLRHAGLTDFRRYWLWPSAAASTVLVPLDERPAVELALTRALGGGPVRRALWRGAATAGAARLSAREVALLAGRPGDGTAGLGAWLEASREDLGLPRADGPLSCLFLTPRFRASASVVVLVTAGRSATPRLVVKLPRSANATASLAREAAGLRAAAARGLDIDGSAPRLVFLGEPEALGGWPALVETAVPGRPLDAVAVRRRPARAADAVEGWLRRVAEGAHRQAGAERLDRLVAGPLKAVAALGPGEQALVERTLEVCAPLAGAELPVVLEHGDLSHPNVLLGPGGRIGAVDWELAEPRGLPLHDLTFFLAYVAGARWRARTPADHEAAVRRAERDTTARLRRRAAALDVAPELVSPLVVASWARQAAGAWRRTEHRDPAWLRQSRLVRLWRRALAVATGNGEVAACASST